MAKEYHNDLHVFLTPYNRAYINLFILHKMKKSMGKQAISFA